jgi:hypothetical protein
MQGRLQIISIILIVVSFSALADDKSVFFKIKHQNCILVTKKVETDDRKFDKLFVKELEKRKYKIMHTAKVNPGTLYLEMSRDHHGHGLYKDCSVELVLKQAKENYKSKRDETLHRKKVRRKYPRITRQGNERCTRALKDAFIHIPNCVIPGKD